MMPGASPTARNFAELQYDAWGQPDSPNKLVNNDHGNYVFATFTGHIYDPVLDIYFAEARFYDAINRTWMAMDPAKDGLNWYQYAFSNPTTYWDPNGLSSTSYFNNMNGSGSASDNFLSEEKSTFGDWLKEKAKNASTALGEWWNKNKAAVSVVAGVTVIAGLGVLTAVTGGAAGVVLGAALSGAIAGGASGAIFGAIGGAIQGDGLSGVLEGAAVGFGSGTIVGALTGAVSSGFNIARGATTITGNVHGSTLHRVAMRMEAGKLAATGQYTTVSMNRMLTSNGMVGRLKPDVIGIGKNGVNKIVEVVSPKQSIQYIENKVATMVNNNPGSVGKVVTWVREIGKIVYRK